MNSYGPKEIKRLLSNWALRAKYRLVTLEKISGMLICSNEKKRLKDLQEALGRSLTHDIGKQKPVHS